VMVQLVLLLPRGRPYLEKAPRHPGSHLRPGSPGGAYFPVAMPSQENCSFSVFGGPCLPGLGNVSTSSKITKPERLRFVESHLSRKERAKDGAPSIYVGVGVGLWRLRWQRGADS
jgi:hypothetical protein